jgi:hypothetical protein
MEGGGRVCCGNVATLFSHKWRFGAKLLEHPQEKIPALLYVEESISSLNIVTSPPTHLDSPILGRRSKQM